MTSESSNPRFHIWVMDSTGSPTKTWDRVGSAAEKKYWSVVGSDPQDPKQSMKFFYWSPMDWRNHRRMPQLDEGTIAIAEKWYVDHGEPPAPLLRAACYYRRDNHPHVARKGRKPPQTK